MKTRLTLFALLVAVLASVVTGCQQADDAAAYLDAIAANAGQASAILGKAAKATREISKDVIVVAKPAKPAAPAVPEHGQDAHATPAPAAAGLTEGP